MDNNAGTWYSEGITNRRKCYIGSVEDLGVVLKGPTGYNRLKASLHEGWIQMIRSLVFL